MLGLLQFDADVEGLHADSVRKRLDLRSRELELVHKKLMLRVESRCTQLQVWLAAGHGGGSVGLRRIGGRSGHVCKFKAIKVKFVTELFFSFILNCDAQAAKPGSSIAQTLNSVYIP